MQLTIVGGGGFRVPAMIDVLARSRAGQGAYASLDVDRVVLYDTDARRLDAMMAVLSSLDFPHSPTVHATTDINQGLPGADFVFSAMRVGGTAASITGCSVKRPSVWAATATRSARSDRRWSWHTP